MNPGRGMIVFRIAMMRVGNSAMTMLLLHRPMAVPGTIRPSRNWPAKQKKETKQRDEETLHRVLFRCVVSLTDDETRFKRFEKLFSSFNSVSPRLWSQNPCGCPQAQGTFGSAIPRYSNRQTVLPIRSVERDSSYPDRTSLNKSCLQSAR
jgi:hypothetical protein